MSGVGKQLATAVITGFTPPVQGSVFIATTRGLFRYELLSGKLHQIGLGKIAVNESVREVLLDGRWLWICTENGLWRMDVSDINNSTDLQEIALLNKQSLNVMTRAADGTLWLGTATMACSATTHSKTRCSALPKLQAIKIACRPTTLVACYLIKAAVMDRHLGWWISLLTSNQPPIAFNRSVKNTACII